MMGFCEFHGAWRRLFVLYFVESMAAIVHPDVGVSASAVRIVEKGFIGFEHNLLFSYILFIN